MRRFVHAFPAQSVCGAAQVEGEAQAPLTQACPAAQAVPTAPQFAGSDWVFTQRPPLAVSPGRHTHVLLTELQY